MQKRAVYGMIPFSLKMMDGKRKKIIGLRGWSCQKLDFSKNPFSFNSYVYLQNENFLQIQKRCGLGGDFYGFTRPHKVEKFKG